MKKNSFSIQGKVWLYPGMSGWHSLTIPNEESQEIKERFGANARGWGSLPVSVVLGETTWQTSIFPDKKSETYLLPLKALVRKRECVYAEDAVTFTITVMG